ncbi:MBL fold metallo-hydrolase [Rhizobium oryzicola]|uniref:MBL fold metallo-hydrolase n=1 Tax=Rhizobium oryzicola TaxID=1232668 RepID=A0ABT8SV42_9HYPH|nr:MBL fold metallo-hydrolase [Rhizobium oryzicola]MDO1582170.1 MBL fold metallo-hydrolase [Rhizobium oryzicola]
MFPSRTYIASAGCRRAIRLLLALSFIVAFMLPQFAEAAAPKVGTQAPGFYRMVLGDFEVTVLSDGTHPFPVHQVMTKAEAQPGGKVLPLDQVSPGEADALLAENGLAVPVQGSINAFLINTGPKLILIDSGAGSLYGPCCGKLIDNMRAAGYQPEQVDEIYITHLHADHVGGIAPGGKMAFPKAIVRVSEEDASYWLSDAQQAKAPSLLKTMFEGDRASLKPYIDAGKFKPFRYGETLSEGILPVAAAGHTPGHSFYRVESKGETLLVWGDVVHVAPLQFADPSVTLAYDSEPVMAAATRLAVFSDAARKGYWVGAAHIAFPGLGHVGQRDGRFIWLPANYDAAPGTVN